MRFRVLINFTTATLLMLSLVCPSGWSQAHGQQGQKGQGQKGQEPLLRLETELVQIDVVVIDQEGKPVRDLKREDFELLENGNPQQITHFAMGTSTRPAAWIRREKKPTADGTATETVAAETRSERYLVLAVDDLHLAPENLLVAKRALHRFIDQQMISGDQIALVTTSGTLGFFQQFTSDREVLRHAINRLSVQERKVTSSMDVPYITDYQAELIDLGDQDALELAVQQILALEGTFFQPPPAGQRGSGGTGTSQSGQPPQGVMSARDRAIAQAKMRARSIIEQNAHFTNATLTALEGIIRSLSPLPGRKIVVLLSDGFLMGGTRGSRHFDMRRITDAATRAGVVIYSLDARGLIATPPGGGAAESSGIASMSVLPGARARIEQEALGAKLHGLNALARDTGGLLITNNNDLNAGFQRVLEDNEIYYVLAYEPAESYRDGRFREIKVRLPGRPELRVRTRKGYFAPNEKEAEKIAEKPKEKSSERIAQEARRARDEQIRTGLGSLFPLRGIPVELAADFLDLPSQGTVAAITAHIDANGIEFTQKDDFHLATLDLAGIIFDEDGKAAKNFGERVNLQLNQRLFEHALRNGFSYRNLVRLKPGIYQVRLAVRQEGTARLGSASSWVEITDLSKKQLALSSILLSSQDRIANVSLWSPQNAAGYQPRLTQASRRFKRNTNVDFLVFVYNAKADSQGFTDTVIQAQVFSGSKLVYASPLNRIAPQGEGDVARIAYAARLSLDSFDPGNYELRLVVIDRAAKTTAQRRANFTVE
jgi:VWFA-related protein